MQKGYAATNTHAILYKTLIAERHMNKLTLNNGGWVTRSTSKAINTTLAAWELSYKVSIKKGTMLFHDPLNEVILPFAASGKITVQIRGLIK